MVIPCMNSDTTHMNKPLAVLFGQSNNGDRYLLGVFDNATGEDKLKLRGVINNFRQKLGGDVVIITTELNQSGLFKI